MKVLSVIALFILVLGTAMPRSAPGGSGPTPSLVPMARVITTPSQYNDKVIGVIGFLVFRGREQVLYASREDAVHGILPNGLELDLPADLDEIPRLSEMNGNYVLIVGKYRAPLPGTQRLTSGSIVQLLELQDESTWGRDQGLPFASCGDNGKE